MLTKASTLPSYSLVCTHVPLSLPQFFHAFQFVVQIAEKICLSEVLTVHGTKDAVIPVEDAHKWQQYIKTHQLCLVEGGDHGFTRSEHATQMVDAVIKHCCH